MSRLFYLVLVLLSGGIANAQSDCLLTTSTTSTAKGLESQVKNTYNLENKLTEESKEILASANGSYTTKKTFEYNPKGYLSKTTEYLNDKVTSVKNRTYDNLGKLISETEGLETTGQNIINRLTTSGTSSIKLYYGENNTISGTEIIEKDASGNVTKHNVLNSENKVNSSKEFRFNEESKTVYAKNNDVVGGMIQETFTDYGSQGQISKDSTYLNNTLIAKTLFDYTDGFLTKKTRIGRNNKVDYEIIYKNDTEGKVIEERFIYNGELLNLVENTYDRFGNLTLEKSYNQNNQLLRTKTWEYNCPN
ncbi:hypothetical protein [Arcticibacterium luteifluviistationis]|nr:hypothetical protein [Arcticibacterium luteifluviistationis]